MRKILVGFLSIVWQFPQVLLSWILRIYYRSDEKGGFRDAKVIYSSRMLGGISLGNTIILGLYYARGDKELNTHRHEWGHTVQSKYLGPLYLPVIGIPSFLWAAMRRIFPSLKSKYSYYYSFYTERWADKLGGVTR